MDIAYVTTREGMRLPVIDVRHPAFSPALDEKEFEPHVRKFCRDEARRARIPRRIQKVILRLLIGRSFLGRGLLDGADSGVLGSMPMYVAKLGPNHLKGIDRRIAAALPSVLARVRLEDMARLLADALDPELRARPVRRLRFVNIAGGPAADSWNALLLLDRALLQRPISIDVLDIDDEGPDFGRRAIASSLLRDLGIAFQHVRYDWRDASSLVFPKNEIVALSSEGGLFDYGTDEEIVKNLEAARPFGFVFAGSVTRDDGPDHFRSSFALRPRSLPAFADLAREAGWRVDRVIERPFSRHVLLR